MKKLVGLAFMLFALATQAQYTITGVVKDAQNDETVVGVPVTIGTGKGALTDLDGQFTITNVANGNYTINVQSAGYPELNTPVTVQGKDVYVELKLKANETKEVEIVADIAIARETPVAFSNVSAEKIKEQLGGNDLPMILNSTPGVYATNRGGSDGDARISIRGFNQRNVAVMIDGIPMNDMENGQVFWSNWFGLDNITRTMQVQRGLGASKLSIPAVGGTINIITSGFDAKRALIFKQEYGNGLNLRSTLSYTSGALKGDWAITAAVSGRRNDGLIDATWSRAIFYYLKIEKRLGKHMLALNGFGAPQANAQRSFRQSIATYSHALARDLGWNDTQLANPAFLERGRLYNQNWGTIPDSAGTIDGVRGGAGVLSERVNFFHKPVISLRHSWQANDKFFLSNIAYASYGNGGGTGLNSSTAVPLNAQTGNYNFLQTINNQATNPFLQYPYQGDTLQLANAYIRASINNHSWYGLLSTFNYRPKDGWQISGGLDLRTYRSEKYRRVYNFLGADMILDNTDQNALAQRVITSKDDKIQYNFGGIVNWLGAFGLAEYKGGNWSAFFNASSAVNTYQRVDYFAKKTDNGDFQRSEVVVLPGYTIKTGANYNVTERSNLYVNAGVFSRAPRFSNIFIRTTGVGNDMPNVLPKNEFVQAAELGYNYTSRNLSFNINSYYTVWQNRPLDFAANINVNGEDYTYNVNGMNARHMGVEFDGAWKLGKRITLEGMVSVGDWIWQSQDTANVVDDFGNIVTRVPFDARGVKVGDAAQITAAASIRYEPIKQLYIKLQGNYFSKNYSDFDPTLLRNENAGRQSWRMPDYYMVDVFVGYGFKVNKVKFDLRVIVNNATNLLFISDASNNAISTFGQNFDATSAQVFVGMPRRLLTSLTITY